MELFVRKKMKDITKQAFEYLKQGFSVIPLGDIFLNEKGEKQVTYVISWEEFQNRIATEQKITEWFEEKKYPNIGIITGKISNLFVLDTDSYKPTYDAKLIKSFNLPPTLCQTTGRGGTQYFFTYSGNARNATGVFTKESAIDIRANGGMVIVPPSKLRVSKGKYSSYTWNISLEDTVPQPLPDLLANRFENKETEKTDWDQFFSEKKGDGIRNMSAAQVAGKILYETSPEMWDVFGVSYFRQWNRDFNIPPLSDKELKATWNSIKKAHLKNNAPPEKIEGTFDDDEKSIITTYKKNKTKGTFYLAKYLTKKYDIITVGEKESEMFVYRNGVYFKAENEIIFPEIQRILTDEVTRAAKGEAFSKIAHMTAYPRSIFESADPRYIPLKNGVYDMQDKILLPQDSKYRFTYQFPVQYDPNATCPKTREALQMILAPDQLNLVQEWIGYYFYRQYIFKKALIIVGPKDSGKTTILESIIYLLGRDNISAVTLQKMAGDRFAAAHLYEKHGNLVDELSDKDIADIGNFKIATGGGSITGEYKFGNQFSFHNFSKLTFACNKIPEVSGPEDDEAYFGRWIVIRLEKRIQKIVPNFVAYLRTEEERSGLFNWAMEGLERLLMNGKFTYDLTEEEIKSEMMQGGSSIAMFAANCIMREDGFEMSKEDMYDVYTEYCRDNKLSTQTIKMFGTRFPSHVNYVADGLITGITEKGKAGRVKGWRNVKIIKKEDDGFKNF